MIVVIGTGVVESYLTDHAGHKGIKVTRSQYQAWLDIVTRANPRAQEVEKRFVSESEHSQGRPSRIQHQGQRLPIGSGRPISGRPSRSGSSAAM